MNPSPVSSRFRFFPAILSVGLLAGATLSSADTTIQTTGQGVYPLSSGTTDAAELSGITHAGGTTYYAVGDNGADSVWELAINVDSQTGILTGSVTGEVAAPGLGTDSEGIAFRPGVSNSAWVSDEVASAITEFSLSTGAAEGSVAVPSIFSPSNVQSNRGLESLAFGAGYLWTANEESLQPDGPISSTSAGSTVRLQRFEGTGFTTQGQWAYVTDPISSMNIFVGGQSGLVELLALPNGQLLALERELGGTWWPRFRSRIYLIDFTGATDVSSVPSLSGASFTPVSKTLLWQSTFSTSNFEGMTLGPELDNGDRSLILISDDGSGSGGTQNLYPLRISFDD